jgi:hypothetical protein
LAILVVGLSACAPGSEPEPGAGASTPPSATLPSQVLSIAGLAAGPAPKIAWAKGMLFNGDPAKEVFPSDVDQFARTEQLVVVRDVEGNVFAYAPDGPVGTTPIGQATGSLAMNTEGNLVAWIAPDGSPTVLQEGEARAAVLEKQDGITAGDAVAVLGRDCFNGPETVEGAGCSVYFRATGTDKPQSFVASNHGFVESLAAGEDGLNLQDADPTGEVGWTTINDDLTTCSAYTGHETLDADAAKSWKTCDHMPLSFSPDGKHVLATGPHGYEGLGASGLSILDRQTGKPTLTVDSNEKSQAAILDMAWEDEAHVLAVVLQQRDAAIVRVGLDGSMELAGEAVRLDQPDDVANFPFRLAIQP